MAAQVVALDAPQVGMDKAMLDIIGAAGPEGIQESKLGVEMKKKVEGFSVGVFKNLVSHAESVHAIERLRAGRGFVIKLTSPNGNGNGHGLTEQLRPGEEIISPPGAATTVTQGWVNGGPAPIEEPKVRLAEAMEAALGKGEQMAAEKSKKTKGKKTPSKSEALKGKASSLLAEYSQEDIDQMTQDSLDLETIRILLKRAMSLAQTEKELKEQVKALKSGRLYLEERLKSWAAGDDSLPPKDELAEPKRAEEPTKDDDPKPPQNPEPDVPAQEPPPSEAPPEEQRDDGKVHIEK